MQWSTDAVLQALVPWPPSNSQNDLENAHQVLAIFEKCDMKGKVSHSWQKSLFRLRTLLDAFKSAAEQNKALRNQLLSIQSKTEVMIVHLCPNG